MKKITTLLLAILMVLPALAGTLYLKPNSNWTQANARFAAYFFGNGEKWVDMTAVADQTDLYQVEAPAGYPNVIFCRMNPSASANNWNNKWNQTGDLTIPTNGNNCFTVPSGSWDGATTTWSVYGEVEVEETLTYSVTVPYGTTECYIRGGMNGWNATLMNKIDDTHYTITFNNVKKSTEYKYSCDASNWDYADANEDNRTWAENDKVIAWKELHANDDITRGVYCLEVTDDWTQGRAWFAAYFFNVNNDEHTFVRGGVKKEDGRVYFGLEDGTYTHVKFLRMNPAAMEESWDDKDVDEDGDPKDLWNKTNNLNYIKPEGNGVRVYRITGWETAEMTEEAVVIATALDRVEVANGIGYAYGVVSAEGAIEVYNVNGAVVARGNNNVDLRGLGRGVYIIRTGNQVRKVVR